MRKIVIPAMLPVLFVNMWVINKFFESEMPFLITLGMYAITTLVPCVLSLWYGWSLREEFINE